ncbi:MAG: hypothetical protein ACLU7M_01970 [Mediterraneibacter gnavus]
MTARNRVTSDSQLYKQAGNGALVASSTIEAIGTLLRQARVQNQVAG